MQSSEYISFSLSLRKSIRSLSSNQKTARPFRKSSRQRNINSVSFTIFKLFTLSNSHSCKTLNDTRITHISLGTNFGTALFLIELHAYFCSVRSVKPTKLTSDMELGKRIFDFDCVSCARSRFRVTIIIDMKEIKQMKRGFSLRDMLCILTCKCYRG